jgi:LacI family transcriptional regulator
VAVLVDTSTTWGRGIITGIHQHAMQVGDWHLLVEARGLDDSAALPEDWKGDGIIARISTPELADDLARRGMPVVNVSGIRLAGWKFPTVCNDGEATACMATEYFLERGFRHFAYLSLHGLECVARQCEAFQHAVAQAECDCHVLGVNMHARFISPDWNLRVGELEMWLESLPKPVAVLTWGGAREVVTACLQAGLRVPQDVAVMSSSDDTLLSQISPIPVSGVRNACEAIGRNAGAMLQAAMDGKAPDVREILIPPVGVATRQSTDTLAISDPAVCSALAFVKSHLSSRIQVEEIARVAGVSRRKLERRFSEILGISPAAYLANARLDQVRRLLCETEMTIHEISDACGYGAPEYMTAMFQKRYSRSPLKFRREMRG